MNEEKFKQASKIFSEFLKKLDQDSPDLKVVKDN